MKCCSNGIAGSRQRFRKHEPTKTKARTGSQISSSAGERGIDLPGNTGQTTVARASVQFVARQFQRLSRLRSDSRPPSRADALRLLIHAIRMPESMPKVLQEPIVTLNAKWFEEYRKSVEWGYAKGLLRSPPTEWPTFSNKPKRQIILNE